MYSNYYCNLPKVCHTRTGNPATHTQDPIRPKMNVQQNDGQITLEFSLAGVLKEDVKMTIKEDVLSLEAQRKPSQGESNYEYQEFGPVEFKTNIQLPKDVNADSIEAQFQNGILKISMNKIVKPNIQVDIK